MKRDVRDAIKEDISRRGALTKTSEALGRLVGMIEVTLMVRIECSPTKPYVAAYFTAHDRTDTVERKMKET